MKKLPCIFAVALSMALASQVNADIVYAQNAASVLLNAMPSGAISSTVEFGDQVQLGGSKRLLTDARLVFQLGPGNAMTGYFFDVTINLRQLDGPAGSPGTIFYTQTESIIDLPNDNGSAQAYFFDVEFPNVVMPDEFAFMMTMTRTNLGNSNIGYVGFQFGNNAATVGFSDNAFFWAETFTGSGVFGMFRFGSPPSTPRSNLLLQLTAVPEPSTIGPLMFGLAGLLFAVGRWR